MKGTISLATLLGITMVLPSVLFAQQEGALRRYEDSLSLVGKNLTSLQSDYTVSQALVKRVSAVRQEVDPARMVELLRRLADSLGVYSPSVTSLLTSSRAILLQIETLNQKIKTAKEKLITLDPAKASAKRQIVRLDKQIVKDLETCDKLGGGFLLATRDSLDGVKRRLEDRIRDTKRRQGDLEQLREHLKKKIEMEKLYLGTVREISAVSAAAPSGLFGVYANLVEASRRDPIHSYDSLFTVARRAADSLINGEFLSRHRAARTVIPRGRCVLLSGKEFVTTGIVLSTLPLSTTEITAQQVSAGNRSLAFAQSLRNLTDKPVDTASTDIVNALLGRFHGRGLTLDEMEYIEASSFEDFDERDRYGVVSSFYEFSPEPRYIYICWDGELTDTVVTASMTRTLGKIRELREQVKLDAWRVGRVWNPKRFLVSAGVIGGWYSVKYSSETKPLEYTLQGPAFWRGSLLAGVRYSIEGNEDTGEGYGYLGIQGSLLRSFSVGDESWRQDEVSGGMTGEKVSSSRIEGQDVALVLTLGRALYIGAGIGKGKISTTTTVAPADEREFTYYVFPAGILFRLGTNSTINVGGVAWWADIFKSVPFYVGLGFTIDMPVIRVGN